jgi:hypothetical protein
MENQLAGRSSNSRTKLRRRQVVSKKAGSLGRGTDAEVLDLNLYSLDAVYK